MNNLPPIKKTAAELAVLLGGETAGDAAVGLEGIAGLQDAGPSDLSFFHNPRYAAAAAETKAGCVLMPSADKDLPCSAKARIYVEDPQWAIAQVLAYLETLRPRTPAVVDTKSAVHYQAKLGPGVSVGAFTVVERGALVGEGTRISAHCFLGENVRVGRGCVIHAGVVIREECVLGDRVIIQPGVVVGGDGYGFSTDRKTGKHRKIPQLGNVVIGDDVEIGANTTIDRGTIGPTAIGAGTKIDNLVQIAHNVQVGRDCLIVAQAGVAGSTTLGDRVILDGAVVMAQTGVMSDIEKGKIVFGYPARPHREAMKLQVLFGRLPEMYDTLKKISQKLGLEA